MHKYSSPTHRSHLWYLPKQKGVLHSITTSVIICTIIRKEAATLRPGRPVHYSDDCWLGWCSEVQGTDGTGKPDASTIPPLASPAGLHWSPYFRREGAQTELEEGKVPWHAGHLNSILPGSQGPCPEKWSTLRPLLQWVGSGRRTAVSSPERTGRVSSNAEMSNAFSMPVCRNRWVRQAASPSLASLVCWRLS